MSNLHQLEQLVEEFCDCHKRYRMLKPRVYGKGHAGEVIIVNYDVMCKKCGKVMNYDIH